MTPGERRYRVHPLSHIGPTVRRLHREAMDEGKGEEFRRQFAGIIDRLERNPAEVGEPRFRLPALDFQVCVVVACPVVIEFAWSEQQKLVFIRKVRRV